MMAMMATAAAPNTDKPNPEHLCSILGFCILLPPFFDLIASKTLKLYILGLD